MWMNFQLSGDPSPSRERGWERGRSTGARARRPCWETSPGNGRCSPVARQRTRAKFIKTCCFLIRRFPYWPAGPVRRVLYSRIQSKTGALKQPVGARQGESDAFLALFLSPNKTYILTANNILGTSEIEALPVCTWFCSCTAVLYQ